MSTDRHAPNSENPLIQHLHDAVRNLEEFTKLNVGEEIPHLKNLELINGRIVAQPHESHNKPVRLFMSMFDPTSQNKKALIRKALLKSIDYLKSHHKLIEKLSEGNEQEKEWAQWAQDTISSYNSIIDHAKTPANSLRNRATKYALEKSGFSVNEDLIRHKIEIPCDPSFYFNSSHTYEEEIEVTSTKITNFLHQNKIPSTAISEQERDIFHMKTISLSKTTKLPNSLRNSLEKMMWETPIHSFTIESSESEEGDAVVSLVQTVIPFPGEMIKVHGAFKRNKNLVVPSVPITESFKISSTSNQTGFPDPSQHTGFAFDNALIPELPHRLNLLPNFRKIYEKKLEIAHKLLPEGLFNSKAKDLWLQKKAVFSKHQEEYIELHRKLAHSLLKTSFYRLPDQEHDLEAVNTFFDALYEESLAYEYLTNTYRQLNKLFISAPFIHLHQTWMEHQNKDLYDENHKKRYQACLLTLDTELTRTCDKVLQQIQTVTTELEQKILNFILHLGRIIGMASRTIILQQLSETIQFAPPLLENFERRIQNCTYRQLLIFQLEIETIETITHDYMKNLIEVEIAIFDSEIDDDPFQDHAQQIINELELYYNSRHYQD